MQLRVAEVRRGGPGTGTRHGCLRPEQLDYEHRHLLPPTPKAAIRALPEAFLSTTAKPVFQAWTTGTSGVPTVVWFSRYELDLAMGLSAVSMMNTVRLRPEDVVALRVSSRAVLGLYNTMRDCRMIGAASFVVGLVDPAENAEPAGDAGPPARQAEPGQPHHSAAQLPERAGRRGREKLLTRVAERGLPPLADIVLHNGPVPGALFVRASLHETTVARDEGDRAMGLALNATIVLTTVAALVFAGIHTCAAPRSTGRRSGSWVA